LLYSRVGAGAASNFHPEPEPHKNNAAPQHWVLNTGSVILVIRYKFYAVTFLYGPFLYVNILYSSLFIRDKIYGVQNLHGTKFIQFKIYTVVFYMVQNLYSSKFIYTVQNLYSTGEKSSNQLRIWWPKSLCELYLA
jgi:hypothetical protein